VAADGLPRAAGTDPDRLYEADLVALLLEAEKDEGDARWRMGDIAVRIDVVYGAQSLQRAAERLMMTTYATLRIRRWVAGAFPESVRRRTLSFSHHEVLAHRDDRLDWLEKAAAGGWTKRRLLEELAAAGDHRPRARELLVEARAEPSPIAVAQAAEVLQAAALAPQRFGDLVEQMGRNGRAAGARRELGRRQLFGRLSSTPPAAGRFQTVVADPPWAYDVRQDDLSHRGLVPYPVQRVEAIAETIRRLDVLADDCALWLWMTNVALGEGRHLPIFEALGLRFSGSIVTWCKVDGAGRPSLGVGERVRGATEHLVLATRGRIALGGHDTPSWFKAPKGSHSEKPDAAYELIRRVSPGPWIDLYALRPRRGWAAWGSEIGFVAAAGDELPEGFVGAEGAPPTPDRLGSAGAASAIGRRIANSRRASRR